MAKNKDDLMEPGVALRHLADHMAWSWYQQLADEHDGLGHINDLWRSMYRDMEALTCLMKFISDHDRREGLGCDFRPIPGFPQYGSRKDEEESSEAIRKE